MGRRKGSKNKPKCVEIANKNNMERINTKDISFPTIHNSMKNHQNPEIETNTLSKNLVDSSFLIPTEDSQKIEFKPKNNIFELKNSSWKNGQEFFEVNNFIVRPPKVNIPVQDQLTYLKTFFSTSLIQHMQDQTNKSIIELNEEGKNMELVSKKELMSFIGVSFYMGKFILPNIKMYWGGIVNSKDFTKNELISNVMISYERYVFIRNHFRISFYIEKNTNTLNLISDKTRTIITAINKMFASIYTPGKQICIDEMTIPFKGNCRALVYNPKKPHKWGLQIKALCDSNSKYIYSLKLWDGEKTSLLNVMKELLMGLEKCNHHLYLDNLYNSFENTQCLFDLGVYITGTLRRRRGGPEFMNNTKLPDLVKNSVIPFTKNNVNVYVFKDSKIVTFISSYHNVKVENMESTFSITHKNENYNGFTTNSRPPEFVKDYNKYMGGVDIVDQALSYYSILRKTNRWTFKFSLHIIQVIVFNSYVLHKEKITDSKKIMTHMDYNFKAIEWFIGWEDSTLNDFSANDTNNINTSNTDNQLGVRSNNSENYTTDIKSNFMSDSFIFNVKEHIPTVIVKKTRCSLCYKLGKTFQTFMYCKKCKKGFCLNKKDYVGLNTMSTMETVMIVLNK